MINITYSAQTLTPAYNPVEFYFSGNSFALQLPNYGYRYIVEVYDDNNNRISRQKVVPQINQQGKIDISRILSNLLTVSFTPSANTVTNATSSYQNYRLSIGEEYIPPYWHYTGITSTPNIYYPTQMVTKVFNAGSTNTFNTGDVVLMLNNPNNELNGYFEIMTANTTGFTVYQPYQTKFSTGTTTGDVNYADRRKVVTTGVTGTTILTVFNGIRSVPDFITYSGSNYLIDTASTTDSLLTNLPPTNFYAAITQDIKLNAYINKISGQTYGLMYQDSLGATGISYTVTGNTKTVSQFNVGYNAMGLTNSANITYYDIWMVNTAGNIQLSKKYRINLDKRCQINDYEIAFMDRMGSIASFNFQLRSKETGTITRTQYKQQLGTTYNTYDKGTTNIYVEFQRNYELNTNWMTDEMSKYFEELLTSPYQWIKMGGIYYACTIIDTTYEIQRQKNQRLIKKNIKVQLANNNSINI